MPNKRLTQLDLPTAHLERCRIRARLLLHGVTVGAVARAAEVHNSFASHVLAGRRSCTTPAGQRVVAAAERLTSMTWGELSAPIHVRPLAA
jgi:hypothetical protein